MQNWSSVGLYGSGDVGSLLLAGWRRPYEGKGGGKSGSKDRDSAISVKSSVLVAKAAGCVGVGPVSTVAV